MKWGRKTSSATQHAINQSLVKTKLMVLEKFPIFFPKLGCKGPRFVMNGQKSPSETMQAVIQSLVNRNQ